MARAGGAAGLGTRARANAWAWAELLRLPALFTVPGDALAGAAAVGTRPNCRTLLAIGSSLCLYEAGMALNDWADRAEDAVERPHRPLPSGRIHPAAALAAAGALTAAGLALAARAGRPSLAIAAPLAATVWAYDLTLKRTPAGPAAMATARGLDVLLGAVATGGTAGGRDRLVGVPATGRAASDPAVPLGAVSTAGTAGSQSRFVGAATTGRAAPGRDVLLGAVATAARPRSRGRLLSTETTGRAARAADVLLGVTAACRIARRALPSALTMATHTLAVTTVSRGETQGGSSVAPLAGLATTGALAWALSNRRSGAGRPGGDASTARHPGRADAPTARRGQASGAAPGPSPSPNPVTDTLREALTLAYAATSARPLFHAALNPSPPLTQRAVGGGIRAMIPLQATLAARAGAPVTALLTAALAPAARTFARKVSVT
ncbi:UbiA family prenyltransferase [Streptomyces sp. NPDC001530]|uniref:UbiA family prenyltransferase n=1 Tax=Streptomyces sp. NPDC001530 TaxID=3364582 RepID=UPI003699B8B1